MTVLFEVSQIIERKKSTQIFDTHIHTKLHNSECLEVDVISLNAL